MKLEFGSDVELRRFYQCPESFSHPAKCHISLLKWIVDNFTKAGDTILDPMCGIGTTLIATTLGRNVTAIDLEQKFIDICHKNWEKLKMIGPELGHSFGNAQIICGDSRGLCEILENQVDKAIFSPPYAESYKGKGNMEARAKRVSEAYPNKRNPWAEAVNPNYHCPSREHYDEGYSDNPENIGNLSYGDISAIDHIITSPPYEEAMGKKHHSPRADKLSEEKKQGMTYSERVDSIITSPPYEGSKEHDKRADDPEQIDKRAKEFEKRGGNFHTPGRMATIARHYAGYNTSEGNIGNLKSQTYLSEMLKVYQAMFNVLKPRGKAIIVVKNFIRNKKVVRLDLDTIKLMEKAGFRLLERHYRKLTQESFWRIIYYQKYPEVEPIEHEDILVFGKPQM